MSRKAPSATRRRVLASFVAGTVPLAGCLGTSSPSPASNATDSPTETPTETESPQKTDQTPATITSAQLQRLVDGNTVFALDLLTRLSNKSPQKNLLYAPYSVAVALAMTYAGAREKTRSQMHETLHYRLHDETLHAGFEELSQKLTRNGTKKPDTTTAIGEGTEMHNEGVPFQLTDANAVWGQQDYPWRDAYLQLLETYYGAGLHEVNYKSHHSRARQTINQWVAKQTREKITDLLPKGSLSRRTRLVLTNAVYFKANWAHTFLKEETSNEPFTALDGSTAMVPMMSQTEQFHYATVDGHQLIELPYVGGDVGMVVMLPAEGEFTQFQQSLNTSRLSTLLDAMNEQRGTISLPRFTYRSKFNLNEVLAALGMPIAFSPRANFTGMTHGTAGGRLRIDDVFHKTYISVDEQGTEAAAATAVGMEATSAVVSSNPFEMTVDRPFLFLIRDRMTGTIIFFGRVVGLGSN